MSKKLTQEQIARQFELPERKSKIATLLKQEGQAYCICRSSDSSRFMIGCDACEEWYHGDCIGINQKEAKHIKRYFCDRCHDEDPSLVTIFKSSTKNVDSDYEPPPRVGRKAESRHREHISSSSGNVSKKAKKISSQADCGQCSACQRMNDCGSCRTCKQSSKQHGRSKCLHRICKKKKNIGGGSGSRFKQMQSSEMHSSGESEDGGGGGGAAAAAAEVNNIPLVLGTTVKPGMQCYGPGCVQVARPSSKYCSDKCGLALATCRILQVLPQRIQEWSMTPSHAEEMNKKELEIIRKKQEEARAALQELDKKHQELDALVERAKNTKVPEEYLVDETEKVKNPKGRRPKGQETEDESSSIYCVTCGHEIHTSTAIKHFEKCFNKYESQTSFGSIYKTRIEGNNMFCDYYNPANRTYCKRLKVLCPEHHKDSKISPTEVCGFPLVRNVFEETGEICKYSKKLCSKHFCWEKLRRAEIDMERVRQWLKIDELLEQERQIRAIMASRAGVLALMLHSTYDHDAMARLSEAQQHGQQDGQQQVAAGAGVVNRNTTNIYRDSR
ncbi:hypothetical protein O3M35_002897 [Rhynocoris fuscipes]|uniref:CXXC-type zinc finger protein 1 n=1 Tax=Rhynocoris fuscipes TaxID=488301 RepID=A0AAW1CPM0_9HEMI